MSQTKAELINAKGDAAFDTDTLYIDSTNNRVGVGTTSPNALLEVSAGTAVSTNGILRLAGTNTNGSASNFCELAATQDVDLTSSALTFSTRLSGTLSEKARIDKNGRLLVGTTSAPPSTSVFAGRSDGSDSPVIRFDTKNSAPANSEQLAALYFGTTADTSFNSGARIVTRRDGGTWTANTSTPTRLEFSTTANGASSPTERIRIGSDGSTNHYTAHTNVHIARSGNAAGTTDSIYVGVRSATNTINGTVVYRVYTNGTYATISDANQKKNIETTRNGYLEDLNKLRVVKYNWNEQEDTDPKELGLIAQEVEQVFPGLVTQIAEDTEDQQYKGIKTSVLPFMLLKALQEASAKIKTLEAKVAALETP